MANNDALLTIVIPARNRAALLPRTLESVEKQTYRPLSVVLVDNGSNDETGQIMKTWCNRVSGQIDAKTVSHPEPGASGARNAGMAHVTTPWVMFFDSDDVMLPNHCADFARAISENPDADIVGRPARAITLDGKSRTRIFEETAPLFNHIFHGMLATQRFAVRTALVRKAGGWNPAALSWNDFELGLRLLMLRPKIIKIDSKPSVIVYSQEDSITGTSFSHCPEKWENTLDLCRSTLVNAGRTDLLLWIDVRSVILAAMYRREGDKENAARLLGETLARNHRHARFLKALYYQNRFLHHGTGRIARLIFRGIDSEVYPARKTACPLTVVIPARNRARLLPATLASVRNQTLRPLNVILVDNDSTDTTLDEMKLWQKSTEGDINVTIITEKRHGAAAARNAGLNAVKTPYVMFFDSDDIMLPNHCADFVDAISASPEVDIVGRPVRVFLLNNHLRKGRFAAANSMFNHIFHSILSTVRYVVRTEFIRNINGWNNKAWGWDDYELGIRLLLNKPRVARIDSKSTVNVHAQTNSITGTSFSTSPMKWENTLDLCEQALIRAGREDLLRWLHVRRMILAAHYMREGAYSEARRLRDATIARSGAPRRMKLLMMQNRIIPRGTYILARLFFPSVPLD